jgi:hypothetical protein
MGTFMLIIAIIVAKFPPGKPGDSISHSAIAAVLMVYCESASYNLSWGPVAWYVPHSSFPDEANVLLGYILEKYSPLGSERLELLSELRRNGCSTLHFPRSRHTQSQTLGGEHFSCSLSSIMRLLFILSSC